MITHPTTLKIRMSFQFARDQIQRKQLFYFKTITFYPLNLRRGQWSLRYLSNTIIR